MYIVIIDPENRTLTLKEMRRDPFGDEEREVLINTYSLDGRPLEADLGLSIALNEDGNVRLDIKDTVAEPKENQSGEFWDGVENELGIEYSNEGIKLNHNKSAVDNYRDFLRYLHQSGYLTQEDLPIGRSNARSRYLVNSEPTHRSSEMSRPEQLAEGIFAETNLSSDAIKRNIRALTEQLVTD